MPDSNNSKSNMAGREVAIDYEYLRGLQNETFVKGIVRG